MKKTAVAFLSVFILAGMLVSCGLGVPRPEIREAKFRFSVTYELNGETKTLEGIYVCEFDGVAWALDSGYTRDWIGYIEGGTMTNNVEICSTNDGGRISIALGLHPTYFMSDPNSAALETPKPKLILDYSNDETGRCALHTTKK